MLLCYCLTCCVLHTGSGVDTEILGGGSPVDPLLRVLLEQRSCSTLCFLGLRETHRCRTRLELVSTSPHCRSCHCHYWSNELWPQGHRVSWGLWKYKHKLRGTGLGQNINTHNDLIVPSSFYGGPHEMRSLS